MTLKVQNDTGTIEDANAYIDRDYFEAYHTLRGNDYTNTTTYPDADVEAAIIKATDYIDTEYSFPGYQTEDDQGTQWPREYVYNLKAEAVEVVPVQVKKDCCEIAAWILENPTLDIISDVTAADQSVSEIKEKIDVIETQIKYNGSRTNKAVIGKAVYIKSAGYLTTDTARFYV